MDRSACRQTPVERYERRRSATTDETRKAAPLFFAEPYLPLHLVIVCPCSDTIASRFVVAREEKSDGRRFTETGHVSSQVAMQQDGAGRIWPVGVLGAATAGSSVIFLF
jgi:hypothetical protein